MSFFDAKIYCKQNLKEDDLSELEYWKNVFDDVISSAEAEYVDEQTPTLARIKNEIVHDFCEVLKTSLGFTMQGNLISVIDGYDTAVEEVENPETFYYSCDSNIECLGHYECEKECNE